MFGLSPAGVAILAVGALAISVLATSLAMESAALFVPAFLLAFPAVVPGFPALSGNDAIGLTLLIMFFGQTSTLLGYWYRGHVDVGLAAGVLLVAVPFAVVGRVGAYLVPDGLLLAAFSALLVGLAALLVVEHRDASPTGESSAGVPRSPARGATFAVGGLVTGMVGVAIGELANTTLHLRDRVPISRSTGTSTLVLYVTLLAANATNLGIVVAGPAGLGEGVAIPWSLALVVAPVVVVGGQVGAWLNSRLPPATVRRLLVAAYVLVAAVTLLRLLA